MLTPSFECSQNDEYVIVRIKVPHVKISSLEYTITNNVFRFYVKPYFLRLCFQQHLKEEEDFAKYDASNGWVIIHLKKKITGEFFQNLNMVTMLLSLPSQKASSKGMTSHNVQNTTSDNEVSQEALDSSLKPFNQAPERPLIEVISSTEFDKNPTNDDQDEQNNEMHDQQDGENQDTFQFDWEQELTAMEQVDESSSSNIELSSEASKRRYGFDRRYNGYFKGYSPEMMKVLVGIDFEGDAEKLDEDMRKHNRIKRISKNEIFDAEHYAADFLSTFSQQGNDEDEPLRKIMKFKPRHCAKKVEKWNPVEEQQLRNLPKKEITLLDHERMVWISLVDLLLSHAYNHRTCLGENTVESPWTITKLCTTISWFEEFQSLSSALVSFIRRVLCFPLYRHYQLAIQCIRDVIDVMKLGKSNVLQCLLEMKYILEHDTSESQRYLLSKIYIDDYCVWIQYQSEQKFHHLCSELEKAVNMIHKDQTEGIKDFQLSLVEKLAIECQQEYEQDLNQQMEKALPL